jgi:hypothetical protein
VICFFGVLGRASFSVDPPYDVLSSVPAFERVCEPADLLRHNDAVSKQFLVAVVTIDRIQQIDLLAEFEKCFTIILGDARCIVIFIFIVRRLFSES